MAQLPTAKHETIFKQVGKKAWPGLYVLILFYHSLHVMSPSIRDKKDIRLLTRLSIYPAPDLIAFITQSSNAVSVLRVMIIAKWFCIEPLCQITTINLFEIWMSNYRKEWNCLCPCARNSLWASETTFNEQNTIHFLRFNNMSAHASAAYIKSYKNLLLVVPWSLLINVYTK